MNSTPKVYRTPRDPGFVGGYNWSAMAAGVLLLLGVNIAATQFVAHRFRYQAALGKPVIEYDSIHLYQPFAWASWVLRHGGSTDPRIRLPILSGALIVVLGSALTVGLAYAMSLRRARELSENTEDLHGSARWATAEDVRATGLFSARQGVYVGGWRDPATRRIHYLRHNGPEHVLAFAPNTERQRRRPGHSHPAGMVGVGGRLRHQRRELGQDRRISRCKRASLLQVLPHRSSQRLPIQSAGGSPDRNAARCLRRAKHRRHDCTHRRRQPAGALLAGCRGVHHDRNDPARLLRSLGRGQGRVPGRPCFRLHTTRSELPRHAGGTRELSS
jgi:hypothetical protein